MSQPTVNVRQARGTWVWEVWSADGRLLQEGTADTARDARRQGGMWILHVHDRPAPKVDHQDWTTPDGPGFREVTR